LRAVNGVARAKIVQTMLAAAPGDGDVQTSRMRNIDGANFSANLIDLLGLHGPYTVTLWDPKQDREHTVILEGIEASKLREQRPKDSATLTFFDDSMIADLKINQFGGKANDKNLDAYIREAFSQIDKKKSRALILDLRDNGGGADELGKLLLSFLVDEPFKYYDDLVLNGLEVGFQKYIARESALPAARGERRSKAKYGFRKQPTWGCMQAP